MTNGYNTNANKVKEVSYSYDSNVPPMVLTGGISTSDTSNGFSYSEIYSSTGEQASNKSTNKNVASTVGIRNITMSQTQNFTFYINGICEADSNFSLSNRNGLFLPIKQLEFKPVSLEHLKIKAGVFADLPFFHRRKMGSVNCTIVDSSRSLIARRIFQWFNSCVYTRGYVPYVDDMCRSAEYIEYTYDGKIANKYSFDVMPDGDISTSRNYENSALTEYRFQLLIVSDMNISSSREGIIEADWAEADWGDGTGDTANYERRVSYKLFHTDYTGTYIDPAISDYL